MDRRFPILRLAAKFAVVGLVVAAFHAAPASAQPGYEPYDSPIPEERTLGRDINRSDSGSFGGLKPGLGREDTYYAFSGCFKVGWIKRQNLRRTEWDMAVDKLVLDCNLLPLGEEEKTIIVNYLVANYGRGR